MIIKILPYIRKDTSALLVFSAAIALILISPLLPLSHILLQPVQAQTLMSFRTVGQAQGTDMNSGQPVGLTFDAHGTSSTSDPSRVEITNGTIQLQAESNGQTYTGNITSGRFTNNTSGGGIDFSAKIDNTDYIAHSACSSADNNSISLSNQYGGTVFTGPVECSSDSQGGGDTAQPSSSSSSPLTGTTQDSGGSSDSNSNKDSDGDGIPDLITVPITQTQDASKKLLIHSSYGDNRGTKYATHSY